MPPQNTSSARGIKALEHFQFGINRIALYTISPRFAVASVGVPQGGLDAELRKNVYDGQTLLWTYAQEYDVTTIAFGVDVHFGDGQKIGHGALTQRAIIAGEIEPNGANAWLITNESGAWGAMGDTDGKTEQLAVVAAVMNMAGLLPDVTSTRAFSRNALMRFIQHKIR